MTTLATEPVAAPSDMERAWLEYEKMPLTDQLGSKYAFYSGWVAARAFTLMEMLRTDAAKTETL